MPSKLVAVTGPLAGSTFPLGAGAVAVGRDRANAIHLRDPTVSRQHCRIEPESQGFRLRDLESRHGTFVNGLPVRERDLDPGDRISVGNTLFLYLLGADAEEPASERESVLWDDGPYAAGTTLHASPSDFLSGEPAVDERTTRDLRALLHIGNALHALRSTEELARRLLELILETIPAGRTTLLLLDRGGEPITSFALERSGAADPFPVSRTLIRKILVERSAVLANDVRQTSVLGQAESVRVTHIQSLLAAPLAVVEGLLGALYVDTLEPGAGFDERHLELLSAVAGIASLALSNVQRVEWLEEERLRLDAAHDRNLIGESSRMREIGHLIARVAPTDSTVLLRGESGTGKEVVARALHDGSRRADRPFVAINCATLSETLLESELFGHEKGAFTGALARKLGKLEVADRGTLFLDEIGEIPTGLQAKLLRALQEREFERLGGVRPIRVDVRVIAATNQDLDKAMKEGRFREDLYYRLNVIAVILPPLRDRREDIPLLASHFAALVGRKLGRPVLGFTPEARTCLLHYDWPGNVRELANAVERAVVLGDGELIRAEDLPETVLEAMPAAGRAPVTHYHTTLNETKKRLILGALEQAGGSVTKAAELLGLNANYLHRLISTLGLRDQLE